MKIHSNQHRVGSVDHNTEKSFHCPECMSRHEFDEDYFCTPFACPTRIATPRFSSPTTSLTDEEFEELIRCMGEINQLLLTLANEPDEELQIQLRHHLRQLIDSFVNVSIKCGDEETKIKGLLKDVGSNFILINDFDHKIFIPFSKICFIQHESAHGEHGAGHEGHHQELINIDTCMRRQLVLNFGEFVSQSPFLLNLFYGLSLEVYLLSFIGCSIRIVVEIEEPNNEENDNIVGKLVDTDEGQLFIEQKDQVDSVNVEEICFIKIK
ncbi:hypothetical protein [Alkalihalobacillus pseudalcaliphilus]|uniref:hypothetical protein n=1 Tax=Alkalihalobacillus pseudalcaliphilus TaxID=79884 RepID=UPI00064DD4D8|nr:hypothetical protein [Alkalihalobacillus pseudalcaliphilus]KMK75129.1 hypothetical protein AB990_16905 [Alkalihalobacillus pseudalcaliphilus]